MPLDTSLVRKPFKVIGTRVRRPDGIDKVTGRAKYGADAFAPGQLVGLVLRSPHAHAKIRKIDTSKAEKLAGVKAIITSADLPDLTGGDRGMRDILENCMARSKALYDGHAVAAVAAVDMHTAKQALKLIKVDYEVLPHVTDVDEALKPSAPLLHDDMLHRRRRAQAHEGLQLRQDCRVRPWRCRRGFQGSRCHHRAKSFKTEQTHQGYIEPHACLANVSPDGTANSG
jgi:CO/xanthine dehydrogenase Mo-binding subunit